jgi:hypothetical protein
MSKRKQDLPLPSLPEPYNEINHYLDYVKYLYDHKIKHNELNAKKQFDKLDQDTKKKLSEKDIEKDLEKKKYENLAKIDKDLIKKLQNEKVEKNTDRNTTIEAFKAQVKDLETKLAGKTLLVEYNQIKNTMLKDSLESVKQEVITKNARIAELENEAQLSELRFKRKHEASVEQFRKEFDAMTTSVEMAKKRFEDANKNDEDRV